MLARLTLIGAWGSLNQYTQQQFRNSTNQFNGEIERGIEHVGRQLKIIKHD